MTDPAPGFTRPLSARELAAAEARRRPQRRTLELVPAVRRALRLGLTFRGRAARDELWRVMLACVLIYAALIILKSLIFGPDYSLSFPPQGGAPRVHIRYNAGWAGSVFALVAAVPLLSLGWRRLHDTNRRGWWMLVPPVLTALLPIMTALLVFGLPAVIDAFAHGHALQARAPRWVGQAMFAVAASYVLLLIQLARRGTPGPNRYGPDPLEVTP